MLAAYREAGIRHVPCHVLKPKAEHLDESAVLVRSDGDRIRFVRSIAVPRESAPAFWFPADIDLPDFLSRLARRCAETRDKINQFRLETPNKSYFNEVLLAYVNRHEEMLSAVRILILSGHADYALSLVRLGYESFLNFYLDWLNPEFFGPRIQLLSKVSDRRRSRRREPASSETAEPEPLSEVVVAALAGLEPLFESVRQKARISPLGDTFYDIAYSWLSSFVHQDYGLTERDALDLATASPRDERFAHDAIRTWANVITAALLLYIEDDVGHPMG